MIWGLVVPMIVAVAAAFGAAAAQRRLRPDVATWTLTLLAGGSALAVLWAVGVLALGFAVEQPALSAAFGWCRALFSSHDHISAPVGVAAWIALVVMVASLIRTVCRRRRAVRPVDEDLIHSDVPIAFAVPGRPGTVVVSTGMLNCLAPDEQRALFAHERSHLRRHHHRFLQIAEMAAAVAPILAPLRAQVRFSTERWADEDAASELGDRRIVARAIARAALATSGGSATAPVMGFTGLTTAARVEALLDRPMRLDRSTVTLAVVGIAGIAVSLGGSGVQFHHLVEFMRHICQI